MKTEEKSICLIYNYAQHYRANIFILLDRDLKCDFYFGDKMSDVRKMDYSLLSHFRKELQNIAISSSIYYQRGAVRLVNEKYTHYIMLGEPYCLTTWMILLLTKLYGKKVYLWTHGWYGKENLIKKLIKKTFFSLASGVFLYGEYAKKLMLNEGFSSEKLHVIYNSLQYDKQLSIREQLKPLSIFSDYFGNSNNNLIFVGRLTAVKKLDMILYALSQFEIQNKFFNMTFIGDGEQLEELRELSEKLKLHNVWFYGPCYDEPEIAELIYNADLCISPGNVGLTAMHSMVYGTPVLTHDNFPMQMPEFEAIIDGITGTFFEYNNQSSLINKINQWFSSLVDREYVRTCCYDVIDTKYNPHIQLETIRKVIQ